MIIQNLIEEVIESPVNRDYRRKFPEDIIHEGLAGQLWFGAECLSAGSCIMNKEVESATMRPLARALTKHLDAVRALLRQQALKANVISKSVRDALALFDRLFAEFELSYVSAMVAVKTVSEYDSLLDVAVLMSESTQRAIKIGLLSQEMLDDYEPRIMFAIPRLAIIGGLLHFPKGPLNPEEPNKMISMFKPYVPLLCKLKKLLGNLSEKDLWLLEETLCDTNPNHKIEESFCNEKDDCIKNKNLLTSSLTNCLDTKVVESEKNSANDNKKSNDQKNEKNDLHQIFVYVSGIADQLQSNHATDMRFVLQSVFKIHSGNSEEEDPFLSDEEELPVGNNVREAPRWVPDDQVQECTSCKTEFTFFKRRHHCRNCGHIFCSACSSHSIPLHHYGFNKPVRVCNYCFSFQLMQNRPRLNDSLNRSSVGSSSNFD